MDPVNVSDVETVSLTSTTSDDAAWVGGFFTYGGKDGTRNSVVISFKVPPGKRLGRHIDTQEETQFILAGEGILIRDSGRQPIKAGDVVVLPINEAHDLENTGDVDLHVIGFFAGPWVEQHWTTERWDPGDSAVTGTPNRDWADG
jgi:mannose-6-phosphate isomerase-like protein (cupin superfamily)